MCAVRVYPFRYLPYLHGMEEMQEMARLAAKYVNTTDRHIFLTGKAGTGKTTFLKYIIENTHKNTVVAAPTGIAAINAGGVTLHSLLQLPFGVFIPENVPYMSGLGQVNMPRTLFRETRFSGQKRQLIRELELLIIDEVSMLRADLLDCIDHTLRHLRRQKHEPFGGLQILFIGDLMQLPPVIKEQELELLRPYYSAGGYFFEALALQENPPIRIELQKIYRQSDQAFIELLNRFRYNLQTEEDLRKLNDHYLSDYEIRELQGYIHLTTHNAKADRINQDRLNQLDAELHEYHAHIEGEFPENSFPTAETLYLKEGAQVMFIKNDPTGQGRFFNGRLAEVSKLSEEEIWVRFEDGDEITVDLYTWENKRYVLNTTTDEIEEKYMGKFEQYPLRLAWAVTIHKSQGLTFDRAILDLSGTFAPGQLYVALSRLTSLKGLVLSSPLPETAPDLSEALVAFSNSFPDKEELSATLEQERRFFIEKFTERVFGMEEISTALRFHLKTYDKDEMRSLKQQYLPWAQKLQDDITGLRETGRKFVAQVKQIVQQETYLPHLATRMASAREYFERELKVCLDDIRTHEDELAKRKKVKGYSEEVREIKALVIRLSRDIARISLFVVEASQNKVLTKAKVRAVNTPHLVMDKPKKKDKKPTAEISLELWKEGKSIAEIAATRGFVISTIEGHLAQYVESGELEAEKLLPAGKLEKIVEAYQQGMEQSSEIKERLGDGFSYSEIRIGIAHAKRLAVK